VQFAQVTFSPSRKLIKFTETFSSDLNETNFQSTSDEARTFGTLRDVFSNKSNQYRQSAHETLLRQAREKR
jgi:hypothetical protein